MLICTPCACCRRVLRLFPHLRRVQLLLQVLLASLPGLSAVSLLTTLMLVVYRYASELACHHTCWHNGLRAC